MNDSWNKIIPTLFNPFQKHDTCDVQLVCVNHDETIFHCHSMILRCCGMPEPVSNKIILKGISVLALQNVLGNVYGQDKIWHCKSINDILSVWEVCQQLQLQRQLNSLQAYSQKLLDKCDTKTKIQWIESLNFYNNDKMNKFLEFLDINTYFNADCWSHKYITRVAPWLILLILKTPKLCLSKDEIWIVCATISHHVASQNKYIEWKDQMKLFDDVIDVARMSVNLCIDNIAKQPTNK